MKRVYNILCKSKIKWLLLFLFLGNRRKRANLVLFTHGILRLDVELSAFKPQ